MRTIRFNDIKSINESVSVELHAAFGRVMRHQQWIQGEELERFEEEWAAFLGVPHAVGCSNGTDALILALQALEIGPGDEVITTSMTFFATTEAILSVGATPVFVDVRPESGLIDPELIQAAITARTRAILPVHLYGQPGAMEAIMRIARARGLVCVEDAAQAHGIFVQDKALGTWGDVGCFSFYPGKNLGALGDAGALVTSSPELARRLRSLRDHGRASKYEHRDLGSNRRMDGLQAAFLRVKLAKMNEWDERRRGLCAIYDERLGALRGLSLPATSDLPSDRGSLHLYVVRHAARDRLAQRLGVEGVETGVHYPVPCHRQPIWLDRFGSLSLPETERFAASCLSLPLSGSMRLEDAEFVVTRLGTATEN